MMVTGGPGTGKSSLGNILFEKKPDIYQNAAQINPDHYKDLLAPEKKLTPEHGTYAHWESSMIADKIMDRLDEKMKAGMRAPHVLMDVAAPYSNRMDFAQNFEIMEVVTGTAPPEITLQRAFDRGFDEAGNVIDRVTPTNIVLGGAGKASELSANVFDHPNLEFTLEDTDVAEFTPPQTVASWDNDTRILTVEDTDTFLNFVERQHINPEALINSSKA